MGSVLIDKCLWVHVLKYIGHKDAKALKII
jgi:hypothetical protein